jgi:hypothetical protein
VQSGDLSLVTITCNNLPYNFLLLDSCLSDGTSEFRFFKPEVSSNITSLSLQEILARVMNEGVLVETFNVRCYM